jgi:hypothetical protein
MAISWSIPCALSFGGEVPALVDSEIRRLRKLIGGHCRGPYDENGIKIGIGIAVDGRNQFNPIKRGGIRLEPFKKNAVNAGVYIRQIDWDVPIESFRVSLWKSAEKAIWTCVERLKREPIQVDESKLKHQLSLVESEFLGETLSQRPEIPRAKIESTLLNALEDDEEQRLIVQYRTAGSGNGSDHDKRVAVENLLGGFLEDADLGYCDGGDIGSGTMNVFCFVKPGKDVGKKVIEVLRKNNLLEGAVIAETDDEGGERVTWPPDFKGDFQLI